MLIQLNTAKAILQKIELPFDNKTMLYILRLDLIDEDISGNKWFKLKNNLAQIANSNIKQLITFGGAFSNHIAATAKVCNLAGIKSVGIIRGEEVSNHTLKKALQNGMELRFVSRSLYRDKSLLNEWLAAQYNLTESLIIPEGGANEAGVDGCKEIVSLVDIPFDFICCACGTGTTLAGIVQGLKAKQQALGFAALKGGSFLFDDVTAAIQNKAFSNFSIIENYHFGGYAKHTPALIAFINSFYLKWNIKLDFVYTAKMMYGLFDLIEQNYFPDNSTIVAIHSGGLQGNQGIGI